MHSNAMGAAAKNARGSRLAVLLPPAREHRLWTAPVRLSQLRKMCECEQVAAVCYRIRNCAIEFLLVQTRGGGRWTFPKGKAEAGLTHAQAAALEAFEEAGVHGRIEEAAFVRYMCGKLDDTRRSERAAAKGLAVSAHLCEVLRLCSPRESNRNRTWFSAPEAKQRLREGRNDADGAEFARVVSRAVARIQRLCWNPSVADQPDGAREARDGIERDGLQKVRFEASRSGADCFQKPALTPYDSRRFNPDEHAVTARVGDARQAAYCDVLSFTPPPQIARSPKLLSGAKSVKAPGK